MLKKKKKQMAFIRCIAKLRNFFFEEFYTPKLWSRDLEVLCYEELPAQDVSFGEINA